MFGYFFRQTGVKVLQRTAYVFFPVWFSLLIISFLWFKPVMTPAAKFFFLNDQGNATIFQKFSLVCITIIINNNFPELIDFHFKLFAYHQAYFPNIFGQQQILDLQCMCNVISCSQIHCSIKFNLVTYLKTCSYRRVIGVHSARIEDHHLALSECRYTVTQTTND